MNNDSAILKQKRKNSIPKRSSLAYKKGTLKKNFMIGRVWLQHTDRQTK